MKTKNLFTLLIAVCFVSFSNAQRGNFTKGSGNIITKKINTSSYDYINAEGSMTVILEKGNEGAIEIKADENIIDFVSVATEGAILKIKLKKNSNFNSRHGIKVFVPFKDLNGLSLNGSGDIISKDAIKTEVFECKLIGSGDIKAEVIATKVEAYLNGSGDIDLSGSTDELSLEMTGSGDFNAFKLTSQKTEVSLNGSGDVQVNAKQSIKARLNGSGDIDYTGNPEVRDVTVKGSGDVDSKN